jgi:hypothetical protein
VFVRVGVRVIACAVPVSHAAAVCVNCRGESFAVEPRVGVRVKACAVRVFAAAAVCVAQEFAHVHVHGTVFDGVGVRVIVLVGVRLAVAVGVKVFVGTCPDCWTITSGLPLLSTVLDSVTNVRPEIEPSGRRQGTSVRTLTVR